ncbi:fimbrial protein [Acinetobacter guillouiae]|uniref:fimbrial protein n=1 Tax=Acinetobacter guillouiae TaxID=106649 RepID=UPI003AF9E047
MKKLALATLSTLVLTLTCTQVFAVDGTITVNGVITDGTCTLDGFATGLKDITVNLGAISKSEFTPTHPKPERYIGVTLYLVNATGTADCDAVTSRAFKGIHLSAISPADLDVDDKTLLVNKAIGEGGASAKNPVFTQIFAVDFDGTNIVDFSAPWGTQAKSSIYTQGPGVFLAYDVKYASKTGVVDAQNYTATVNYTMHYN